MLLIASSALAAFVACWIALLFHELGHSAAAEAVGVRIWGMRLGVGPTLWSSTINGRRLQICALPFVGSVSLLDADADAIGYRDIMSGRWRFEWGPQAWRAPVISAAGGLSNLFGMLIFLVASQAVEVNGSDPFTHNLVLFGIATNLAGYLNLLPGWRSDGQHLVTHLSAARAAAEPIPTS